MNSNSTNPQALIKICLTLTVLFLPISISLQAIFLIISLIIITLYQYKDFKKIIKTPWFISMLLLIASIAISCLFSPANPHTQLQLFSKYSKLLFLPILVIGFQDPETRNYTIYAFLLAMLFTVCLSVLKTQGYLINLGENIDAIFHNRIITGYYMAFSAFIAAIYTLNTQNKMRWIYALLTIIYSGYILFINTSRTGYIVFAILTLLLIIYNIKYSLKFLLILTIFTALGLSLQKYTPIPTDIRNSIQEVQNYYHGNQNTRVGFRLQFHQYAYHLFMRSPIWGLGTGAFSYYFAKEQLIPSWGPTLFEPHSAYWLIMTEQGLIGLSLLLTFFITLFYATYQIKKFKLLTQGLLLTFIACCWSDGMIVLSTGYFFLLFVAVGLGETLHPDPKE